MRHLIALVLLCLLVSGAMATTYSGFTPTMTSNSAPTGNTTVASSEYSSSYAAWKAFNHDTTDAGWVANAAAPGWIQIHLSSSHALSNYTIWPRQDVLTATPTAWKLNASNDGSTWVTLDSQTGISWGSTAPKSFPFANTVSYSYYNLTMSSNPTYQLGFTELYLYEIPDATSVDFSSSPNPSAVSESVTFTSTGSGTPDTLNWTFGDIGGSNTSAALSPTHAYSAAGTYTVMLNITNKSGSWMNTSHTHTVSADLFPPWTAYGDAWKTTNATYTQIKWTGTGAHTWLATGNASSIAYLVIAGGGGGGRYFGGGGGAGGLLSGSSAVSGSYPVYVGAGGAGGTSAGKPACDGVNGTFSSIGAIANATGGGGGGGAYGADYDNGHAGGSGGGAQGYSAATGGANVSGQGFPGASTTGGSSYGGGGGGAGGPGVATVGGYGPGLANSITGSAVTYARGGNGTLTGGTGASGAANTGNGGTGGGITSPYTGGDGGSGVVIIGYWQILSASFTQNPNPSNIDQSVQFTDTSAGSATTWNWSFGDGNTSTQKNPTHAFPSAGDFTIMMNVTDSTGTWSNTSGVHTASAGAETTPLAMFTKNHWIVLFPVPIQFTDASTNTPTVWNWSFGDGSYSSTQSPSHRYVKRGVWTVLLNASNTAGYSTNTSQVWILGG